MMDLRCKSAEPKLIVMPRVAFWLLANCAVQHHYSNRADEANKYSRGSSTKHITTVLFSADLQGPAFVGCIKPFPVIQWTQPISTHAAQLSHHFHSYAAVYVLLLIGYGSSCMVVI